MKLNYDKIADAIYIQIKVGKIDSTMEISDVVIHDLDKNGNILGIELLNASHQLGSKDLENGIKNGIPLNIISATPILV